MITYINSDNARKYTQLFSEAEDALVKYWTGEGINPEDENHFGPKVTDPETGDTYYTNGISSLNSYFSWIQDLLNLTSYKTTDGKTEVLDGMRFSMLPVDEDVFSIDANTRKITVPASFKANGISVQSDEVSEVIYFKINRFYDATDLFNQDIMIEWITPKSDKYPEGLKGYSVPTVKALDDTTNHIIFGWALSSEITEVAGDVTFAVRFYKYDSDNNKIQYSLSTLTEKATIKPNIGLDIPRLLGSEGALDGYKVLGDEVKALIRERAENSQFGSKGDKAVEPELYEPDFTVNPTNDNAPYVVVLAKNEDGTVSATVNGTGFSTDGGAISYFWKKFDYETGDRVQTDGANKLAYKDVYKAYALADAKTLQAKVPSMQFYKKVSDSPEAYELTTLEAAETAEIATVYRKDSECIFDGVGYYKFVIKNRAGRSTETHETDPIIVYPASTPVDVELTTDVEGAKANEVFLDDADRNKITVTCTIPDHPDEDDLPAFARNDAVKVGYKDKDGNIVAKYTFKPEEESVKYQWQYKSRTGTEFADLEGKTETNKDKKASLKPTEEGTYKCVLKGELNGNESAAVESPECRVTYRPAIPTLQVGGTAITTNTGVSLSTDKKLAAWSSLTADDQAAINIDNGDYMLFVGRNKPMSLSYSYTSMSTSGGGTLTDHQLTDSIDYQWYCYELRRDSNGKTVSSPDKDDAYEAKRGAYVPMTKSSATEMADVAVEGASGTFTVADLEALKEAQNTGLVVLSGAAGFTPSKDGYYFCVITNHYNGMDTTISTPFVFYDKTDD